MSENSGKIAAVISVALLLYLISPPIVYKVSQLARVPMNEGVFVAIYAPLLPLVTNVKPYARLMQAEAEYLQLDSETP